MPVYMMRSVGATTMVDHCPCIVSPKVHRSVDLHLRGNNWHGARTAVQVDEGWLPTRPLLQPARSCFQPMTGRRGGIRYSSAARNADRSKSHLGLSRPRLRHDGTVVVHSDEAGYRAVTRLSATASELIGSLAIYSYAQERYEASVFADGGFVGRPQDGFDLAANL
jgi:hypothetical protein